MNSWIGHFILLLFKEKIETILTKNSLFVYRIDINKPRRIPRKRNWKFLQLKRIQLFYRYFSHRQFRKFESLGRRKEGSEESNFVLYLENRLSAFLYRLNFFSSMLEVLWFLRKKFCLVNNVVKTLPSFFIKFGSFVRLKEKLIKFLRLKIYQRFLWGSIFFNTPRYLIFSYKLMFGFVFKRAYAIDVAYPNSVVDSYGKTFYLPNVGIDIYRGSDYI